MVWVGDGRLMSGRGTTPTGILRWSKIFRTTSRFEMKAKMIMGVAHRLQVSGSTPMTRFISRAQGKRYLRLDGGEAATCYWVVVAVVAAAVVAVVAAAVVAVVAAAVVAVVAAAVVVVMVIVERVLGDSRRGWWERVRWRGWQEGAQL